MARQITLVLRLQTPATTSLLRFTARPVSRPRATNVRHHGQGVVLPRRLPGPPARPRPRRRSSCASPGPPARPRRNRHPPDVDAVAPVREQRQLREQEHLPGQHQSPLHPAARGSLLVQQQPLRQGQCRRRPGHRLRAHALPPGHQCLRLRVLCRQRVPGRTGAVPLEQAVFYDTCYLRFSDANFFVSTKNDDTTIALINDQSVNSPVRAFFDSAVGTLLNATGDYAAANTTRRYATGEEGFDNSNESIYALTQCTPDLSPVDCRSCLGDMFRSRPQYLSGRIGARIIGMRCNFRYEMYRIVPGTSSLRLPALPLPPGTAPAAPAPAPVNATPTATQRGGSRKETGTILATALPIAAAVLAITLGCLCFTRRSSKERPRSYSTNPNDIESVDSLLLDISTLRAATGNFHEGNKLGEGGLGAVYKGILPDGQEIAVKRLSQSSGQGIQELKNELVLVAKFQHKNLVRLIDTEESKQLDWGKRLKIINGTARGLQYLHEDSPLKIIHRDLKPSNVLLDSNYTPRISDFGLARLFGVEQTREVTSHVVGPYGYIAPEYAMRGYYSIKSDIFSFGVMILEILIGKRNSANLLSLVWKHWTTGTIVEIIDPFLRGNAPAEQMLKCVHIGLLCVQDNPIDRPIMSTVNVMLSTRRVSLPVLLKPVLIPESRTYPSSYSESYSAAKQPTSKSDAVSPNVVSVTELEPR